MPPKYLEAKRRHHYVWANYLRRWTQDKESGFYTTKTGKIAQDSVRGIVVDDYFYKITTLTPWHVEVIKRFSQGSPDHLHRQHMSYLKSFLEIQQAEKLYRQNGIKDPKIEQYLEATTCNLLENLHSSHEQAVLPILAALADENLDVLVDQKHMLDFMIFIGQQSCRTKAFRDNAIRVLDWGNDLAARVADAISHSWWFLSYMNGMSLGWSLYSGRHEARHALLINDTTTPFITSDQPVVNVHPCVSETELIAPAHADFYYPISPRIAYIVCDSNRFERGINHVNLSDVIEFNSKQAAQAMVHIIGHTKEAIAPFKKDVGRRYRKNFSRIYQFKERLKHLVDAVDAVVPKHGVQFGPFIKQFAKEFDQEIRERNQIHHFQRFSDLDTDRLYLTGFRDTVYPDKGWKEEQRYYYRKVAKVWAQRVQRRGALLDAFLDAVAEALLRRCPFLSEGQ